MANTTEKLIGKIDFAELCDGGKYTVNISPDCRWEESERREVITKQAEHLREILKDAKCNYVSELKNKPVEVVIQNNTFKSFRILTEVL